MLQVGNLMASVPKRSPKARRELLRSFLRLSAYLWNEMHAYSETHPQTSAKTVLVAGLKELGMKVDDEDLVALRARPIRPCGDETGPLSQVSTTIQLPRYLWEQIENYAEQERISKRHVFVRGLKALGMQVRPEDESSRSPII